MIDWNWVLPEVIIYLPVTIWLLNALRGIYIGRNEGAKAKGLVKRFKGTGPDMLGARLHAAHMARSIRRNMMWLWGCFFIGLISIAITIMWGPTTTEVNVFRQIVIPLIFILGENSIVNEIKDKRELREALNGLYVNRIKGENDGYPESSDK